MLKSAEKSAVSYKNYTSSSCPVLILRMCFLVLLHTPRTGAQRQVNSKVTVNL